MTNRSLRAAVCSVTLLLVGAACGGGGTTSNGVASVGGNSNGSSTTVSKADAEKQLLDYVKCLRGQGLDVPDPQVDGQGNMQLRPPNNGGGTPPSIDQGAFQKAQAACGDPPRSVTGGFDPQNNTAFQDAALKFAQCMRGEGLDVPDPDFSNAGTPGAGGGPFGSLDRNDPKVQAASDKCRKVFTDAGIQAPGAGGAPGASTGN